MRAVDVAIVHVVPDYNQWLMKESKSERYRALPESKSNSKLKESTSECDVWQTC